LSAVPDGPCGERGKCVRIDCFGYAVLKVSDVINQSDGDDLRDRFIALLSGHMPEEAAGVPPNHRHHANEASVPGWNMPVAGAVLGCCK
jgi:hypothetical protein